MVQIVGTAPKTKRLPFLGLPSLNGAKTPESKNFHKQINNLATCLISKMPFPSADRPAFCSSI
jgi:hypothetical protein